MSVFKNYITFFLYSLLWISLSVELVAAQVRINDTDPLALPDNSLITKKDWGMIEILTYVESFLLQVVLPLVVVWVFLYVAFELLTAEGNEEKMKKAWKVVTYTSIGLITIALAYAIVAMASRLSF